MENMKRFASILKRIGGGVFSLNVDNALYGMKNPKILFTIVQPSKDNSGKYVPAKFFLDSKEAMNLVRRAYQVRGDGEQEIFKSYKGGMDTKHNCVMARVFSARIVNGRNGKSYVFSVENCEGEQKYTQDKYGNKVKGIVSVKSGGQTFARNSIGLNAEEFYYVIDSIRMELQAYRTVINTDMFYHPDKYRFGQQESEPPAEDIASAM